MTNGDDWGEEADAWGGIDDEVQPSEPSEPSEPRDPSESGRTAEPSELSDPSDPSEPSDPSDIKLASPIKSKWDEFPTYLYPDLHDDVEEMFDDIEYACKKEVGWKPEKYRHFQAVAWHLALEQLEDMEPEEFVDRVAELGLRE